MKKNLILFTVCILLGTTAYLIEEKGAIEKRASKEKAETIFNMQEMGGIKEFHTKNSSIKFVNNIAIISENNRRVDPQRLKIAFDELAKIRLVRVLDEFEVTKENRKFFFPNNEDIMEFVFERGKVRYLLGQKIATSRSFYMEIQKEDQVHQVIVHNPNPLKVVVSKEKSESDDTHYRTLKSIINLNDFFFEDLHLLYDDLKLRIGKTKTIHFENRRNRPFLLDVENGATIPKPPGLVNVSNQKIKKFLDTMGAMQGNKQYEQFDKNDFPEAIGQVIFDRNESHSWTMKIYNKMKNKEGYFISVNSGKKNKVFEVRATDAYELLANSQNFWNKKLELPKKTFAKLSFPEESAIPFELLDEKKFSVKTLGGKKEINNREFQKIYQFLKKEAEFVTEGHGTSSPQIIQSLFDLQLDQLKLRVMKTKGEVIVHERTSDVRYHYIAGSNLPFSYQSGEVAPLKKVIK